MKMCGCISANSGNNGATDNSVSFVEQSETEHKEVKAKPFMQGLATAGVLAFVLAGCAAAEEPAPAPEPEVTVEQPEATDNAAVTLGAPEGLAKEGVVSFCIDPEYPPMEYFADGTGGEIIGFDADMQRAMAEAWGIEVEFVVTAFDGLMPGLQAERCDILMSGLYLSEARLEVAEGNPYFNAGPGLVTRAGDEGKYQTQMDLCGVQVTTQAAAVNAQIIRDLGPVCEAEGKAAPILTEYPKVSETVFALLNERADVLIETNVAAAYIATTNEGLATTRPDIFPPDTQFGIYTRPGSPLTAAVAEVLKFMNDNGTIEALANKYGLKVEDINIGS
jgi:polar amino acid transport system substrate-binding protein